MDRRNFLKNSGMSLIAFTLLGKSTYAFSSSKEAAGSCLPTTADILGPFYRTGAPFRTDLTVPGDPGTPLAFEGKVFDSSCNPIENAIVDVWHADDAGAYDNTSAAYDYRGKYQTSADGSYTFTSIKAGWYLNGSQYRPSHIHFRVTAPGFTELITQLYFQNDPYIANDPWASDPDAQLRIVPVVNNNGIDTAVFDIYLQGNGTGMNETPHNSPVKIGENPFKNEVTISSSEQMENLEVFNAQGDLVVREYDIKSAQLQLKMGYVGKGIYYARVQTDKGIYVHKLVKQ
jgi:protocatechuate 3,4-dioxygenase beta subunit